MARASYFPYYAVVAASAGFVLSSCDGVTATPPAAPTAISEDLAARVGASITIDGVFEAWSVGNCRFAPSFRSIARTRSDWLVRSGENCIYVTGGFPPGGSVNPAEAGRKISVQGEVIRDEEGKLLLRHTASRFAD